MSNYPLISVCIPAYNAADYIEEAVKGWQNQTYANIEIIVQDDCSKDNTYNLALALANVDLRIKVFKNNINLGIGANWNEAFKKAKGDYFVMANADDIYDAKIIENALRIFEAERIVDAVSFNYKLLDDFSKQIAEVNIQKELSVGLQQNFFKQCFFKNPYHIIFTVFKVQSLKSLILDDGSLFMNTQVCDVELFFRASKNKLNLYYSDYMGGYYRKHDSNNSSIVNGERYSWLFDVFPVYRQFLLDNYQKETTALLLNRIVHHLKYQTKRFKLPEFKQFNRFLKEYFTFKGYKKD